MRNFDHLLLPKPTTVVQEVGFLRRMFAFILDILIIDILVTAPFTKIFTSLISRIETQKITELAYTNQEMTAIAIIFAIAFMYFVLFEYLLGQTPGMMLLDTHIYGENTLSNSVIRNSFIIPVFPFILLWAIEPIAIIFWKRSITEHITNTRTVKKRSVYIRRQNS